MRVCVCVYICIYIPSTHKRNTYLKLGTFLGILGLQAL